MLPEQVVSNRIHEIDVVASENASQMQEGTLPGIQDPDFSRQRPCQTFQTLQCRGIRSLDANRYPRKVRARCRLAESLQEIQDPARSRIRFQHLQRQSSRHMDQNPVLRQHSLFPQTRSQGRNRLIADSQEIQLRGHIQTVLLQNFQTTPGGFRAQTSSQGPGIFRVPAQHLHPANPGPFQSRRQMESHVPRPYQDSPQLPFPLLFQRKTRH